MMMPLDINPGGLLPEIILFTAAALLLFIRSSVHRSVMPLVAALAVVVAGFAVCLSWGQETTAFSGLLLRDRRAILFQILTLAATLMVLFLSHEHFRERKKAGEYYSLLLMSLCGLMVMIVAQDLLVVFLGTEILSLSLYILVGILKKVREGMEAAIKYFLLGSFSSALYLLGLTFYYGMSGTTALSVQSSAPAFLFGSALILAGLGFKIAAVPFHGWAPDTYEGAPVSVASFLSIAPKIGSLAVILNIALGAGIIGREITTPLIEVMALGSMVLGNLAALRQQGVVRLLAYSGISQIGYMLMGLLALPEGGSAILFYLLIYTFMDLGVFAAVIKYTRPHQGRLQISDLAGLAARHPLSAFATAVFLVSLAGIPPTGGFFAKFYLFKAVIAAGHLWIVFVAIAATVVSLFYYLRIVMVMYMQESPEGVTPGREGLSLIDAVMAAGAATILLFGIIPAPFLEIFSIL